ncbi:MAG: hypothetical protein WB626_02940 [Bacteroidota bacterium]
MDKPSRMPQVYGYLVCLTAVITVLICISSLVYAVLDLSDPLVAGYIHGGNPSLASYENYRMDILKSFAREGDAAKTSLIPDEKTLRAMYEAAREDWIRRVEHEARRTIMIDIILILICVVLFATHWRWVRKPAQAAP